MAASAVFFHCCSLQIKPFCLFCSFLWFHAIYSFSNFLEGEYGQNKMSFASNIDYLDLDDLR